MGPGCHRAPTAPELRTTGLRNGRWSEDKMRNTLSTPRRPGSSKNVEEQSEYPQYEEYVVCFEPGKWGGRLNVMPSQVGNRPRSGGAAIEKHVARQSAERLKLDLSVFPTRLSFRGFHESLVKRLSCYLRFSSSGSLSFYHFLRIPPPIP